MQKSIHTVQQRELQNLLKNVRQEAGLNQEALAALIDEPQSFISKYESGERRLDIIELWYICHKLGLDLAQFSERLEQVLEQYAETLELLPEALPETPPDSSPESPSTSSAS